MYSVRTHDLGSLVGDHFDIFGTEAKNQKKHTLTILASLWIPTQFPPAHRYGKFRFHLPFANTVLSRPQRTRSFESASAKPRNLSPLYGYGDFYSGSGHVHYCRDNTVPDLASEIARCIRFVPDPWPDNVDFGIDCRHPVNIISSLGDSTLCRPIVGKCYLHSAFTLNLAIR